MKNTAGVAKRRGRKAPESVQQQYKKNKRETAVSPRLANFVLQMSKQLIEAQRYEIYLGLKRKWSKTRISKEIGVSVSTVCREVRRNSNADGEYVWINAQRKSNARRHGFQGNHRKPAELWWRIEQLIIDEDWSPGQIAGVLRKEGIHIVKQTIYNHVHQDPRGILAAHMPHELKYTRRLRRLPPTKATNIANRTSIHDRPKEADGTRFGDWEMDTIVDSHGHAILTLTERSTNFLLMERLKYGRKAQQCASTVVRLLFPYREQVKTITTDNGCEFAAHQEITRLLTPRGKEPIVVYFADSYCSWQKGTIENTNKLIRKYLPKKADLSTFTDKYIMKVQKKINRRPREKLNFESPKDRFFKHYN